MASLNAQTEAEALATCEAEPIRSPDRIQAHGALIVSDRNLGPVTHVSENIEGFVGKPPSAILGAPLRKTLHPRDLHAIRNALSISSINLQREFLGKLSVPGTKTVGAVHLRENRVLLELTHGGAQSDGAVDGLERLRWLMTRQTSNFTLKDALDGMVRDLHAIIGFDRVMAYRFRPDGSGEVLAERHAPGMDSFLGLRFPSQDIPKSARAICLEQPLRVIADTGSDDVAVLADATQVTPLDLTLAELRGTSPVHTAYLRNMGVGASLVLPIVIDNRLWGLFSCHHRTARILTIEETTVFDLVGRMLNVTIDAIHKRDRTGKITECEALTRHLSPEVAPKAQTMFSTASWAAFSSELMSLFKADGMVLSYGNKQHSAGVRPDPDVFAMLDDALVVSSSHGVASSSDLLKTHPCSGDVAGMMRIDLFPDQDTGFWLFRREENETVNWAGSPQKDIEKTAQQTRLHPRSSFKAYAELSQGSSRAWEPEEIELAEALQSALRRIIDVHLERTETEKHLSLLVQELNHRVRNILSVIQSLVRQSAEGHSDVDQYAAALEARVLALASAHDLLTAADSRGLSVQAVVRRELAPFTRNPIDVSGPDIQLQPSASTVFALVLHEIVTNSAKHGALSYPQGSVTLTWDLRDTMLRLAWRERDGPPVKEPDRKGFGLFLIDQAIGHQLDGQSSVAFHPDGVEITLSIPVDHLVIGLDASATMMTSVQSAEKPQGSIGLGRVLVLEDDFMIAAESRSSLFKAGASSVVLASNNAKAIAAVNEEKPDLAILDINLGHEDSRATARHLLKAGVPFLFLSGYSGDHDWLGELPDVPLINKPLHQEDLMVAIQATTEVFS